MFSPNNWVFRVTLDSIDIAILNQLQTDSRIPMVELAKRVNLSPTPCVKRVKRLESEGSHQGISCNARPGSPWPFAAGVRPGFTAQHR